MPEKPVDSGLWATSRAGSEANPLGFSLGFIEGSALVSLRDRILAEGLVIRALDLELAEVEFPLNLKGGADEFQRRSTRLRTLVLDLDLKTLSAHLSGALKSLASPIFDVAIELDGTRVLLEASLGPGAPAIAELFLSPGEPRNVRVHLGPAMVFGPHGVSSLALPDHLAAAAKSLLLRFGERVAQSWKKVGPSSFSFDPVDALLWALMPWAGWKVPAHDESPLSRLEILAAGQLRLVVGSASASDFPAQATPIELAAQEERLLRALAKEDSAAVAARAAHLIEMGDAVGAFEALRGQLDASGGPEVVRDRLLAIGVADQRLHAEVADLADDFLALDPESTPSLLAKAAIPDERSDGQVYERIARGLRERGQKRAAGLAFRAASALTKAGAEGKVRLLEEAIALRPDDVEALRGLVDELPALGRASAAVRAARRLANLARDPETRVRAHVAAGELLRGALGDPVQAKRELERALRIKPDEPRALEALAKAVTDQGDPRRAASIWEKLIQQAEAEGQKTKAAEWCQVLGDLWRMLDPEAALLRYRQAFELEPGRAMAYARYAEACTACGRVEAAIEGVERGLPRINQTTPKDAALSLRLAAAKLYEGTPGRSIDAITQYEEALVVDPDAEAALSALDHLYRSEGMFDKRATILSRLASLASARGDLDRAAVLWQERVGASGTSVAQLAEIAKEVDQALGKERGHRALLEVQIEIAAKQDDPEQLAAAIGRRLLFDDPSSVRASLYARLGRALDRAGRQSEAGRAYEEAIGIDPDQPTAISALVRIYRSREDQDRLAAVLERHAELQPRPEDRAESLAERAQLLASRGKDAEAFKSIQRSLELHVGGPERLLLATELALRVKNTDYAKDVLVQRIKAGPEGGKNGLAIALDLARVAELTGDRDELIAALEKGRDLADPASETGRSLAARLASELSGADRLADLAELQRRRGRIASLPPVERAERFVEAARLAVRLGDDRAADADVEDALRLLGNSKGEIGLRLSALATLEEIADRRGDSSAKAEVLGRRARLLTDPEAQERSYLDQAQAFAKADRLEDALTSLEEATRVLPGSLPLFEQLGARAESVGRHQVVASALGRAATLAEEKRQVDAALGFHARAAAAALRQGDRELASRHDRRCLELSPPGRRAPELIEAVIRLEEEARGLGDNELLFDLLGRRAAMADRTTAAGLLLEQSDLASARLGDDRRALEALRRARELAPENTPIAMTVLARLEEALSKLGLHAEQAAVLVERADRSTTPEERSDLYLAAAQVYADPVLGDRGMALSRAQAAVRAHPGNDVARALRISLLRDAGRRDALAEALAEEASHSAEAGRAADLWLEAASVLLPPQEAPGASPRVIEQALALTRRASTAIPQSRRPLEVSLGYVRALGRADEELVVLGQILERDPPVGERMALRFRRIELYEHALKDSFAAQAEIGATVKLIQQSSRAHLEDALANLPRSTAEALGLLHEPDPVQALLDRQLDLTEHDRDWPGHVAALLAKVDLAADPSARVELRLRAGAVLEHQLGDAAGAEREYLAVLALESKQPRAEEALLGLYLGLDRFEELAQNLGVDALRKVWVELPDQAPKSRRRRVAEALWPALPAGGRERAEVQLALADLYSTEDIEPQEEGRLLEQVVQEAPPELEVAALERLGVYYLEAERYDRYCETLRRRTERITDDRERARAIAELGEALEWKLGDGAGAEVEYRTALAIDPSCAEARARLADILTAQDRFDDLARDLGTPVLETALTALLGAEREETRAFAAAGVLAGQLPQEERPALWLRVADAAGPELAPRALQRAASEAGPARAEALDRLVALLEARDEKGELANVLRQRLELETVKARRLEYHLRLSRLVLSMRPQAGAPGREAIEEEAERELRRALELNPEEPEARELLGGLYIEQSRFLDLGRVLGIEAVAELRDRAVRTSDKPMVRTLLGALAELSEGPVRANLLLELIAYADGNETLDPTMPRTAEQLYRAAIAADPGSIEAREGLRAMLEADGRFTDIADVLGIEALRETVEQLRPLEVPVGLLPAISALAKKLKETGAPAMEQAASLVEVAALHLGEDDPAAAERSLREALAISPGHGLAKEELRELLVAQHRLADLAEIDEGLLAITVSEAANTGDIRLEIEALSVLADRRSGPDRADTLVLIAAIEKRSGDNSQAQARLQQALHVAPGHELARAELESLFWQSDRYSDIAAGLGSRALLDRVLKIEESDPGRALLAVRSALDAFDDRGRAEALEISARLRDPQLREAEDLQRSMADLRRARGIWDKLGDREGQLRARVALVQMIRAQDDVPALLDALAEAAIYATDLETRSTLVLERATLLALSENKDQARALVEPLVRTAETPPAQRLDAARMLVEDLLGDDAYRLAPPELELKAEALELLTSLPTPADHKGQWWLALAAVREARGEDPRRVAEALEAALRLAGDKEAELPIRRRLQTLYEELGEWAPAESHASIIADAEPGSSLWVAVSELRVWLDDREGAKEALDRALELEPASRQAHESLLRLAEQAAEPQAVITRLEAWAEADRTGNEVDRAARLLRAARLAGDSGDSDRAALLAERAISLMPRGDARTEQVAKEACAILAPLDKPDAMVAILTRALAEASGRAQADLRIQLSELLVGLRRINEAATVVEQGVHRETPADDPLIERLLADSRKLESDVAVRRLLALADRLGTGPAARRLRTEGAERAEALGDQHLAKSAWSNVASEVGGGEATRHARSALVRLARELGDRPALLQALIEAAEDATAPEERAALLLEAAELANTELADPGKAEGLLRRAMVERPGDPELERRLIDLYQRHQRWLDLEEALADRCARLQGGDLAAALTLRAKVKERHLHDPEGAAFCRVLAYRASSLPEVGAQALPGLLDAGRFAEAESLSKELLAVDTLDLQLRVVAERTLADAYEAQGKLDEAAGVLATLDSRGTPVLLELRLDFLARHERYIELATTLDGAAERLPPQAGLRHRLAAARVWREQVKDSSASEAALFGALRLVERAMATPGAGELDPGPPPFLGRMSIDVPLLDLADTAAFQGRTALRVDALRLYAQSLGEGPSQWRALIHLAAAEREAGDLEAAQFTLRGVVEAVRTSSQISLLERVEAESALGAVLAERGDLSGAVDALESTVGLLDARPDLGQRRAETQAKLAEVLFRAGRPKEALESALAARQVDPALVSAALLEPLIEASGSTADHAELLERRARTAQLERDKGLLLHRAAEVWRKLERHDRALTALLEAHESAPANREHAEMLETMLYEAEGWPELAQLLGRRLAIEDLTEAERAQLLVSRARILVLHLDELEEGISLLVEARDLQPVSLEILSDLAQYAEASGQEDLCRDSWARIATLSPSRRARAQALVERVVGYERTGDLAHAVKCLEEAIDLALDAREVPRALIEHAIELHQRRQDHSAVARLLVKSAAASSGLEAAALYDRAAHVRLHALEDRRGATAAFGAAAMESPEDIAIRRALIDLSVSLGDLEHAKQHARGAVLAATARGEPLARVAYLIEEAHFHALLGESDAELGIWRELLSLPEGSEQSLLDELVSRARATLSPEAVESLLAMRISALPSGQARGRFRVARARILEEPLGRHWEAQGERDLVVREDRISSEPGIAELTGLTPGTGNGGPGADDNYRVLRSMLDRSGRWEELADLEERRAAQLDDPLARSDSLLQVARFYGESQRGETDRVRDALLRALEAYPDNVEALARLARLEVAEGAWTRAAGVFARLEALGGPAWPTPEFELLGAEVARHAGEPRRAVARLLSALRRDPGAIAVKRALAQSADVEPAVAAAWLNDYAQSLDPVLDRSACLDTVVRRGRLLLQSGDPQGAAIVLDGIEREPLAPKEARTLRLVALEESGRTRPLLDALEAEAFETPALARHSLTRALELASEAGELDRAARIAARLAQTTFAEDPIWPRLLMALWSGREGPALLQAVEAVGGLSVLGELSEDQRARLATSLFEAARWGEGATVLAALLPGPEQGPLDRARRRGALGPFERATTRALGLGSSLGLSGARRALEDRLRYLSDAEGGPGVLRFFEGLAVVYPDDRRITELLAEIHRRLGRTSSAAAAVMRRMLADDPTHLDHLQALVAVLPEAERDGAAATLQFLRTGATYGAPSTPAAGSREEVFGRVLHESVQTPLAEVLALTAIPVATALRSIRGGAQLRPASADPRVADLVDPIRSVLEVPFAAVIDPNLGAQAVLDAGELPTLVIGELLLEVAEAAEIRFHLARALMLLQLGALTVERSPDRNVIGWLEQAVDPTAPSRLDGEHAELGIRIRDQLGPAGVDTLSAMLPALARSKDRDLGSWVRGAYLTANRFGALYARDLTASLRGLRRLDPRLRYFPWNTVEARREIVARWSPFSDLASFMVSADYTTLLAALAAETQDRDRY